VGASLLPAPVRILRATRAHQAPVQAWRKDTWPLGKRVTSPRSGTRRCAARAGARKPSRACWRTPWRSASGPRSWSSTPAAPRPRATGTASTASWPRSSGWRRTRPWWYSRASPSACSPRTASRHWCSWPTPTSSATGPLRSPRRSWVLMANANVVGHWGIRAAFQALVDQGLTAYAGMTAGAWQYIGAQGILQGAYETFMATARAMRRLPGWPPRGHGRAGGHGRRPALGRRVGRHGHPGGGGRPAPRRAPLARGLRAAESSG